MLLITTLFNLFCPFLSKFSIRFRVRSIVFLTVLFLGVLAVPLAVKPSKSFKIRASLGLFPLRGLYLGLMSRGFLCLAGLNLVSLVCYSYPVTTTLGFNLNMALALWISGVLFKTVKELMWGRLLPANSPWYLAPFLSLIEAISLRVRPITLCFRLLANIRAGHVLLTLICKITLGLWVLGTLFGVLELIVSLVQAFVFLMLTAVYLDEAIRH